MLSDLLKPEIQKFIQENEENDASVLMFKSKKYPDWPFKVVVAQIESKQRAKKKLSEWYSTLGIIFPPKGNLEQASSQKAAEFKASYLVGKVFIDLTGGSGVDSYYISKQFDKSHYVEVVKSLANIAKHNFTTLSANIEVHNCSAEEFLESFEGKADCIFIDPSRRDEALNRVFKLEDCSPNVIELEEKLLQKAKLIVIKASPLVDIQSVFEELSHAFKIQVLAIDNEVKEVLIYLKDEPQENKEIEAWNISEKSEEEGAFKFHLNEEKEAIANYSEPKIFLYEPNPAIMKAGAFNLIAARFGIEKLHPNSHFYVSDERIEDFPGRTFKVISSIKLSKKTVSKYFPDGKVNLISRNYILQTNEIKKRFGLKDGGEQFLICTKSFAQPQLCLICERLD